MEIEYAVDVINAESLDYDLKTALGAICSGFVWDGKLLRLVMDEKATKIELALADTIIKGHDPSKLSDAQQKEILQVAQLTQKRDEIGGTKIDEKLFRDNNLLAELAKRMAWLELEVRQLRGF